MLFPYFLTMYAHRFEWFFFSFALMLLSWSFPELIMFLISFFSDAVLPTAPVANSEEMPASTPEDVPPLVPPVLPEVPPVVAVLAAALLDAVSIPFMRDATISSPYNPEVLTRFYSTVLILVSTFDSEVL